MTQISKRGENSRLAIIALLFLLSGAGGLIYEIVWERLLELYFGVTLTAITLIVSAYLTGLGFGSLFGGQIAGKIRRVVLAYGVTEAAIGAYGYFSLSLINWIGQNTAGSPYPLVFLLSFVLLCLPTFLMGMTLPLLAQSFVNRVDSSGRVIGLLYGINTFGAAFGAWMGGSLLIGWLGFDGAAQIAVVLNLVAGFGAAAFLGRYENQPEESHERQSAGKMQMPYAAVIIAAFLVGFIDLGFEMIWFRVLGVLNKPTAYGFPSILFVFLTGLAIGGYVLGRKADATDDRIKLFWIVQIASGITSALSFLIFWGLIQLDTLQPWIHAWYTNSQHPSPPFALANHEFILSRRLIILGVFEYFLPIIILVFPASILMGGGLPILDKIAITTTNVSGRRVGEIHLANILGSVGGTLAISFVFLPLAGTELTLKLLALLSLFFISLAWSSWKNSGTNKVLLPIILVAIIVILPSRGKFYKELHETATGTRAVVHESGESVLALGYARNAASPSSLWVGGIQNSFFPTQGNYERSALTCASASKPEKILIIGLGGANTAYFTTRLPEVQEIVIVEIIKDLPRLLLDQSVPAAQRALSDPRVRMIADDGRRYLYAHPEDRFDMIFIDPLYSFTAGHNNLYSRQAMELYRAHLNDGGVLCAWFNEQHIIPKTAASVFPYSHQYRNLLVAGDEPIQIDREYIQSVSAAYLAGSAGLYSERTEEALNYPGILKDFVTDREGTLSSEADMPILTDMTPWLEYYFFRKPVR